VMSAPTNPPTTITAIIDQLIRCGGKESHHLRSR
jgi:hypothetical protein